MNTQEANELVERAKRFLNQTLEIIVLDSKGKPTGKKNGVFTGWSGISFNENKGQENVSLYGKIDCQSQLYFPSLENVVREFERLERLKEENQ